MSSSFFSHETFVVEQHRKVFELRNQYPIFNTAGAEIGTIEQVKQSLAILPRFALTDPSGEESGEVRAQNWRAKDFTVADQAGNEVATAAKKWRALATEMSTDADTYAVTPQPYASEPVRLALPRPSPSTS